MLSFVLTKCGCTTLVLTDIPLYGAIIREDSSRNVFAPDYMPFVAEDGNRYFVRENYDEEMSVPTKISDLLDIQFADLLANPDDIRVTLYANYGGLTDDDKNVNGTLTDVIRLVQRVTDFDIVIQTGVNYDGVTVTDPRIIGDISSLNTDNQIYNRAMFNDTVGDFAMTNGTVFYDGQLINIKLRL